MSAAECAYHTLTTPAIHGALSHGQNIYDDSLAHYVGCPFLIAAAHKVLFTRIPDVLWSQLVGIRSVLALADTDVNYNLATILRLAIMSFSYHAVRDSASPTSNLTAHAHAAYDIYHACVPSHIGCLRCRR